MLSQIWQWMRARYGRAFFGYGLLGFTFVGLAAMFWQVHVTTPFFAIGVAWSFRMAFARRKMRTVRLRNEELARLEALAERIGGATGRPMSDVERLSVVSGTDDRCWAHVGCRCFAGPGEKVCAFRRSFVIKRRGKAVPGSGWC